MAPCGRCGREVLTEAAACPHCGAGTPAPESQPQVSPSAFARKVPGLAPRPATPTPKPPHATSVKADWRLIGWVLIAMCVVALAGIALRFGSGKQRPVNAAVSAQSGSSAVPDISLIVINDTDTDISWLNETGALSRERVKLGKSDEQTRYSTPTEWVHK